MTCKLGIRCGWPALLAAALYCLPTDAGRGQQFLRDREGDTLIRRTDLSETGPIDPYRHRRIDLLSITLARWFPRDPHLDVFVGEVSRDGDFFRMDVRLAGLVNPPGDISGDRWRPFFYGPHPVFGFIELDVDASVETGGEVRSPQFRYTANVARFGGMPSGPRFANRIAASRADARLPFNHPPLVKRSGEEFHLAFLGEYFEPHLYRVIEGDENGTFDAGEIWRFRESRMFHRAHGFEGLSLLEFCTERGSYQPPETDLEFRHDLRTDVTIISMVFPMTNAGCARKRREPVQEPNTSACDQVSIDEGLVDLVRSAHFWRRRPYGPEHKPIIIEWSRRMPRELEQPGEWAVNAILGSTYLSRPSRDPDEIFVWTDVYPDPLRCDVNGDGQVNELDRRLIAAYVVEHGHEGEAPIRAFANDFSLFDVNYSGSVDEFDLVCRPRACDSDGDDDVDLVDFTLFQHCYSGPNARYPEPRCAQVDPNRDGSVDLDDLAEFIRLLHGPDTR